MPAKPHRRGVGDHRSAVVDVEGGGKLAGVGRLLVLGAVAAVILLIIVMSWLNKRSLETPEPQANAPAAAAAQPQAPVPTAQQPAPQVAAAPAQGPVVITAIEPAWVQVTDQGKTLFEGMMQPGQAYSVPPTATAPELKAGKPEALKVTVGSAIAPAVGPPGKVASHVSLKPDALMHGGAPASPPAAPVANVAGQ